MMRLFKYQSIKYIGKVVEFVLYMILMIIKMILTTKISDIMHNRNEALKRLKKYLIKSMQENLIQQGRNNSNYKLLQLYFFF